MIVDEWTMAPTPHRKGPAKRKRSKVRPRSKTGQKPSGYVKRPDTPKAKRDWLTVKAAPALVDCMKTLGHRPRGRKRVKR